MTSLTHINAPGAFPETPMNEEDPMQRTVRNESFRREEPRGVSGGAERDTPRSGHNLTDSGIFVDEPSLAEGPGPAISSHEAPYQPAHFAKDTTPRSLGNDEFSGPPRGGDAVVNMNDNTVSGDQYRDAGLASAPGAYRIGPHDNLTADDHGNYTYDTMSTMQPMDGMGVERHDDGVSIGTALGFPVPLNTSKTSAYTCKPENTFKSESHFKPASAFKLSNAFTPANTPATVTPLAASGTDPMAGSRAEHSMAGLTDTKPTQKDWSEVPFGTGIYNGVTGHGSNESPARQPSLLERYSPDPDVGVHNGVIGRGSEDSASVYSQMSTEKEHDSTATKSPTKQRVFPLVSHSKTKSADMSSNADERERDSSHSKGMLAAGAGAAAMGGYAAHHGLSSKDDHHKVERATEIPRKGEEKTLPFRPAAAVKEKKRAEDLHRDYSRDTENHHQGENDSHHIGRLGAAGAAGAYGAHKLAHHDGEKEHRSTGLEDTSSATREQPQYNTLSDGTPSGILAGSEDQTGAARGSESKQQPWYNQLSDGTPSGIMTNAHATTESPRYNTLSDSVPSGIATGTPHDSQQSHSQYNKLSDGTPSGVAVDDAAQHQQQYQGQPQKERSSISSDSSNGGMYNVLSSGTPSGINLENVHHHH